MSDARDIWRTLHALTTEPGPALDLDLAGATWIDGAVMALLVELRNALVRRGTVSELVGASDAVRPLVRLYRGDEPPPPHAPAVASPGMIARVGAATERLALRARDRVGFAGELVEALGQVARTPARASWPAVPGLIERAAADGVPIVLAIEFLIGFVLAYQTLEPIELLGANIYVADLVGIAVTRELGPLMAAFIMVGRSGAAYAAELGTMRVNEEIDALRTMGFGPVAYLVVPRVLALAIAAPILALLGDLAAVVGGLVVALTSLELTARGFLTELRLAVVPWDVWTGLIKSVAFGAAIAIIGCQQGLATSGAAAGVGRGTTATVVYCLFSIVVIDTLFTMLFRAVGV
jgi:phospholipid/cholesterol/gamma-HCH transport system permease protein